MQITRSRPFARGVDQLMFIGDTAVDQLAQAQKPLVIGLSSLDLGIVAFAAALAPRGKRLKRAGVAAGICFVWNLAAGRLAV